jgi:hypothetical protein
VKIRGDPEIHLSGTAEGCEIRGDSKIRRRQQLEGAGSEETWSLIRKLDETMLWFE